MFKMIRGAKRLVIILVVMLLILSVVACGTKTDNGDGGTTDSTGVTGVSSTGGNGMNSVQGTFDITDIVTNGIALNSKKISLPCKISDLGDGWHIKDTSKIKSKSDFNSYIDSMMQQDKKSTEIFLKANKYPRTIITNGSDEIEVQFCEYSDSGYDDIMICGLSDSSGVLNLISLANKENPKEEMKKVFGEWLNTQAGSWGSEKTPLISYQYYNSEEMSEYETLGVSLLNDSEIFSIGVLYIPIEYR